MAHFAFFFKTARLHCVWWADGSVAGDGDEAVKNVTKRPPTHVAQAVMAYTATQHSLVKFAEFSPL